MTHSHRTSIKPNFRNRTLYHGDNLEFLRGMNSETVHLIATDPPFNKNRDFHATPDSLAAGARFRDRWRWEEDVHEEWTDSIKDDWLAVWEVIDAARAAWGDDMGAFLCWLGVRLMEMHRVLRPDGSLYLHIDHTAHAYVKCMMDAIFGWKNFRNEIIWCYTGPSNTKRWFPRKHDTLLFYVKSDAARFHRDHIRVPYDKETLARRGRVEGERSIISPSVENTGRRSNLEIRAEFGAGKVPEDWWPDIASLTNQVEKTGYPTQKPLALYRRIIEASSNEGDFVLDPFCGCATTPVAAEQLKRQWVGMDIWDGAKDIVLERLQKEWLFTPEASESKKNHVPA
ncbi:MAG: site-specific DNA-methyltransferase [Anaerolineaceae bacterium]|nr:site-specific DNA-methyltransferase [Anaerolineaceae bacterium]